MTYVMVSPSSSCDSWLVTTDDQPVGARPNGDDVSAGGETKTPALSAAGLLAMKVSRIIEAHPDALDVLISGGFEPLANPVMRFAMAHTVNLEQAFRIRGMDDEAEDALVEKLLALGIDRKDD